MITLHVADSDHDKCEHFNELFSSIFTVENHTSIPQHISDEHRSSLTNITITLVTVFDKLSQLNPTKTSGPED